MATALTVLCMGGCATTSTTDTSSGGSTSANTLRVGISPESPPLAFNTSGKHQGIEPDLARAMAADLGKEVTFVDMSWDRLIDALLKEEVDIIMSGITITPARQMRINFSNPYMRAGQTALVRRSDVNKLSLSLFSSETKVGAQKATTGANFVEQNFPKSPRKFYSTAKQGARAVADKKIDAFVCDAPLNWWLASEYEAEGLTVVGGYLNTEYLAWGIRKNDAELLKAVNEFVEQIKEDDRLQSIIKTWIPYE